MQNTGASTDVYWLLFLYGINQRFRAVEISKQAIFRASVDGSLGFSKKLCL
jgi:hypothetical protein